MICTAFCRIVGSKVTRFSGDTRRRVRLLIPTDSRNGSGSSMSVPTLVQTWSIAWAVFREATRKRKSMGVASLPLDVA